MPLLLSFHGNAIVRHLGIYRRYFKYVLFPLEVLGNGILQISNTHERLFQATSLPR